LGWDVVKDEAIAEVPIGLFSTELFKLQSQNGDKK